MTKENIVSIALVAISFLSATVAIYGLALAGEPQSVWLMKLIGVM